MCTESWWAMSDNLEGLAETVADYKIGDGLVQNFNTIFGWVGFLTCRKKTDAAGLAAVDCLSILFWVLFNY